MTFKLKSFSKYIVSIALLAVFLMYMDIPVLIEKISSVNMRFFSLAIFLIVGQILFLNMRWHSLLQVGNREISFKVSSLINISGYFANILFITSVGGIITKSGLAVRHGLSVLQAVFITFLDRFMTFAALVVLSALGLPFLYHIIDSTLLGMLAFSVFSIIASILLILLALRSGMLRGFILSSRKRSRLIILLREYTEDYALMLKVGAYSLIAQMLFIISVYALAQGFVSGQNVNAAQFFALIPVLAFIASLPISFGGWGVREGAFIYGLSLIGFSMEEAFLLSVQVGLVTLIAPFFVGFPYMLQPDFRAFLLGKKRDLSAHTAS